jgi:hypothetical protein
MRKYTDFDRALDTFWKEMKKVEGKRKSRKE